MTTHVLYRMYAADGALLYVGITNNPKARLRTHSKEQPWFDEVANITVTTFGSREELAAAEYQAIKDESPRYNIACNPVRLPPTPEPLATCPTCQSPSPRQMPVDEWELLGEDGKYRPFCTNPFHFPGVEEAARVHADRDLLRKTKLLRLSAAAEERLELHRAALTKVWDDVLAQGEAS